MNIKQKAREIAEVVWNRTADETNQWASISGFEQEEFTRHVKAGIIEGLEMAAKVAEQWNENSPHNSRAAAIRALIEEQKP